MIRPETLRRAVQTAIASKCSRTIISVPSWAITYGVMHMLDDLKALRSRFRNELSAVGGDK